MAIIDFDVSDYIDDLTTKELKRELAHRGETLDIPLLWRIIDQLDDAWKFGNATLFASALDDLRHIPSAEARDEKLLDLYQKDRRAARVS